jgi:hypothetical protein
MTTKAIRTRIEQLDAGIWRDRFDATWLGNSPTTDAQFHQWLKEGEIPEEYNINDARELYAVLMAAKWIAEDQVPTAADVARTHKLAIKHGWAALPIERRFQCFYNSLGWWHWSVGLHLDVRHPHIELHIPFGFFRLGWFRSPTFDHPRTFGYDGWNEQPSA